MRRAELAKTILLAVSWALLVAFLISTECPHTQDGIPSTSKPVVDLLPNCTVTVTRDLSTTNIAISGAVRGGGKITMVFAPAGLQSMVHADFDVTDVFNFGVKYPVPKAENLIPMVFLFERGRQYVCLLKFVHADGSRLTPGEIDGMMRTKAAIDTRRR